MKTVKIIREIMLILSGIGAISVGIIVESEDPWIYLIGAGLVLWGIWDIYKEVKGSSTKENKKIE